MDAIGLFGLLMLALSGGSSAPAARPGRRSTPAPKQLPPAPSPWPAAVPDGLPTFPGAGWEYDEPPPLAVQQRAAQLVAPLWRQGKGSARVDFTDGRWIAYRAEIVKGGKQGVVAYRVKGSSTLKRPPATEARAPAPSSPSSPSSWTLPAILTAASPGWPQPMAGGGVVNVVAGRWYQWNARIDVAGIPPGQEHDFAVGIVKGLSLAGAVNIAVSDSPPFAAAYQLQAKQSITVPLGVAIAFEVLGRKGSITFLAAKPIDPPKAPKVPIEKPPGWVDVSMPAAGPAATDIPIETPTGTIYAKPPERERSPLDMPDLKIGARGEDVKLLQRRLGISDDGQFGKGTQTAVIEFQRKTGLAPNLPTETLRARGFGAVKQATWVKLFGVRA